MQLKDRCLTITTLINTGIAHDGPWALLFGRSIMPAPITADLSLNFGTKPTPSQFHPHPASRLRFRNVAVWQPWWAPDGTGFAGNL